MKELIKWNHEQGVVVVIEDGHMIKALDEPGVSETEVLDIAIGFLFDGRPMSECRGYLLSEYDVNADELGPLLEKAEREVRGFEMEFGGPNSPAETGDNNKTEFNNSPPSDSKTSDKGAAKKSEKDKP